MQMSEIKGKVSVCYIVVVNLWALTGACKIASYQTADAH